MISRENFVFTIGYEGDKAVVDAKAKKQFGKLDTFALADAGHYRAAFASAMYSRNDAEVDAFIKHYNARAKTSFSTKEEFSRLFGVALETIEKILEIG